MLFRSQNTILDIQASKLEEARKATQSYDQQVAYLNERIKYQQRLADIHWQKKDVESYLSAAEAVKKYRKELEGLTADHNKAQEHGAGQVLKEIDNASAQAKRILQNEEAAKRARAAGQDREADQFERSAEQYRRGATEQQRQEADKIKRDVEGVQKADPQILSKLDELNTNMAKLRELWN